MVGECIHFVCTSNIECSAVNNCIVKRAKWLAPTAQIRERGSTADPRSFLH